MKRLLIIFVLAVLTLTVSAQSFFKPVSKDIFPSGGDRSAVSTWLVRPYFNVTALKIEFGETTTIEPFSSLGTGVTYGLFKEVNGEPYQVFAANLAVLFGTEIGETTPLELSIAATVTGWQYISAGIGYDFTNKNVFLLTAFTFNFNK